MLKPISAALVTTSMSMVDGAAAGPLEGAEAEMTTFPQTSGTNGTHSHRQCVDSGLRLLLRKDHPEGAPPSYCSCSTSSTPGASLPLE